MFKQNKLCDLLSIIIPGYITVHLRETKDGVQTVTVTENGRVVSKTVNGHPAALEDWGGGISAVEGSSRSKKTRSKWNYMFVHAYIHTCTVYTIVVHVDKCSTIICAVHIL